ncbi:glycine N-acyltransferase-like protein 3 isoform X2 [Corythoichthys intestinalis]|uniref:glycine N-acyltransferase-like protein 3 isoform X2 n=1 Tax=Corythoichthys intestinalis TaxID=161448 RepID=UPI0025A59855|nr:glycine N-acyltransferase-like protein 3 isoform X2 [Corythoichthys intestinalis]
MIAICEFTFTACLCVLGWGAKLRHVTLLNDLVCTEMKVLQQNDELMTAEGILLEHLPKSFQVYGHLYAYNRNKQSTIQVVVDTWPDFKVIICRPDPRQEFGFTPEMTMYCKESKDGHALKEILMKDSLFNWSSNINGGCDISHTSILQEVSLNREVNYRSLALTRLLHLPNRSHLVKPAIDSGLESRISSLELCHAHLVNQTWKFGGTQQGYNYIAFLISNFPTYCITDNEGQPISWLLVYEYLALGVLYTMPKHRKRGFAKALIQTMAQRLFDQDYPVFCYIEEDNMASYKLFKSLGFIEEPSYRELWFEFNF